MDTSRSERESWRHRNTGRCSCTDAIPGVTAGRVSRSCPQHGRLADVLVVPQRAQDAPELVDHLEAGLFGWLDETGGA